MCFRLLVWFSWLVLDAEIVARCLLLGFRWEVWNAVEEKGTALNVFVGDVASRSSFV